MDIDLLRRGVADRDSLSQLVRDCAVLDGSNDGVTFDPASIVSEDIAKDAAYSGTRIKMDGRLGNVRLRIQVDFGVGDAVVPGPRLIEYPAFLGQPPVALRAYPIESAMAEKFQAMVELDMANSRMKDFYDIWACSRHLEFDDKMAEVVRDIDQFVMPVALAAAQSERFEKNWSTGGPWR